MKKIIITSCLFFYAYCLYAQDQNIETEIRRLEQTEVQAVLSKDTGTLKKLWDRDYIVNNPDNKIVFATANPADRPVMQRSRSSFTRDVEKILINGDIVISMGSETVVPSGDAANSGETVKRRYTNIWMKKGDSWKLAARHANVICQRGFAETK
ncbi:MAG: nuclear transport factor 2 family protein [Bacteroidota bacterium]|nr:nuclear transport factor 2 family protein [Bacteroidota bacterium]